MLPRSSLVRGYHVNKVFDGRAKYMVSNLSMETSSEHVYVLKETKHRSKRDICIIALKVLVALAIFFLGFIIGYFAVKGQTQYATKPPPDAGARSADNSAALHERLVSSLQAQSVEQFSRHFTRRPHLAGGEENKNLAEYIRDKWSKYGFDKVEMIRYDVLLSMPPEDKPNTVKLFDKRDKKVLLEVQGENEAQNKTDFPSPFLAYSAPGNVTGDLLYVNYGTTQDFAKIAGLGLDCKGKIVIMRHGKIFRGEKVDHAQQCGAIGVILYSDPADCAPEGINNTYPQSWWLPETGAQYGAILHSAHGEVLTPGLPATEGMFRNPINKTDEFYEIPAHTMSYGDAVKFLQRMSGQEAPNDWQGGLPITYKTGPGFTDNNLKVRLEVNNKYITKPIYNVIGSVLGKEEPDRLVLMGSHRDDWGFGAVHSSSSSSVMMEVSRGLGKLLTETDWRPRRTIMLCSWDAEEFGLIGSFEWVEDNRNILSDRAVFYIDLNSVVSGNHSFIARGSPLLTDLAYKTSRMVEDPNTPEQDDSLFDTWYKNYPSPSVQGKPDFRRMLFASDYVPLSKYVGVPSLDLAYTFQSMMTTSNPVTHTIYDTFYWQKTFNDPDFKVHLAIAQISARMLLGVADEHVLPFSLAHYKRALQGNLASLEKQYSSALVEGNVSLSHLREAIDKFSVKAEEFDARKAGVDGEADSTTLRMLNDQIILLERSFIWPYGMPGRLWYRHVIFENRFHYGVPSFPGISEVLSTIEETKDWDEVKRQVSIVTQCLREAARVLAALKKE